MKTPYIYIKDNDLYIEGNHTWVIRSLRDFDKFMTAIDKNLESFENGYLHSSDLIYPEKYTDNLEVISLIENKFYYEK